MMGMANNYKKKRKKIKETFTMEHSKCTIITDTKEAIAIAKERLKKDLKVLNRFVKDHPEWKESFEPIEIPDAPHIVEEMEKHARNCKVGPMASVAGVLADRMMHEMLG